MTSDPEFIVVPPARRRFAYFLVAATIYLIFAGALVTSMGAGLSVPDWPLSYGQVFPEMTGGVFYEHGHRLIASFVGLCMLVLAAWLAFAEPRRWVRNLGYWGLAAVSAQGLLGGITVLLMLPPAVSIMHAILAQTFLSLTIVLAYSQSLERAARIGVEGDGAIRLDASARRSLILLALVFVQLVVAAAMRHSKAGLAIPDFPLMGGEIIPLFDDAMLATINAWREARHYPPVVLDQVLVHFLHRLLGVALLAASIWVIPAAKARKERPELRRTALVVHLAIVAQFALGVAAIWTEKHPHVTSLHVVLGAVILGGSVLLVLRTAPVRLGRIFLEPGAGEELEIAETGRLDAGRPESGREDGR